MRLGPRDLWIEIGFGIEVFLFRGSWGNRLGHTAFCYNLNKIAALARQQTKQKENQTLPHSGSGISFRPEKYRTTYLPSGHPSGYRKQKHRYNHKTINRSWPFHLITDHHRLICMQPVDSLALWQVQASTEVQTPKTKPNSLPFHPMPALLPSWPATSSPAIHNI